MRQIQLKNKLLKNKVIWDYQKLQNNLETPVWTCTPEKTSVLRNMRNIDDFVDSVTVLRNPSLGLLFRYFILKFFSFNPHIFFDVLSPFHQNKVYDF